MKVYKISVDDVYLGVVVNNDGSKDSEEALDAWNAENPSYQGDTAQDTQFISI